MWNPCALQEAETTPLFPPFPLSLSSLGLGETSIRAYWLFLYQSNLARLHHYSQQKHILSRFSYVWFI